MSDKVSVAVKVAHTVQEKEELYGKAFDKNGRILEILYPNGASGSDIKRMSLVVRMLDKICRYAHNNDKDGESPLEDLMGYCILGLEKDSEKEIEEDNPAPSLEEAPDAGRGVSSGQSLRSVIK
jgi:hypothetical protein